MGGCSGCLLLMQREMTFERRASSSCRKKLEWRSVGGPCADNSTFGFSFWAMRAVLLQIQCFSACVDVSRAGHWIIRANAARFPTLFTP